MMPLFFSTICIRKPIVVGARFKYRKALAVALLLLLAFSAGALAQTAQWVKQMGIGGISNGVSSDAAGNVYAADGGNKRIQVFDNNGTFKSAITGIGAPMALCMTAGPNQVLYVSNSNPPEDFDSGGEIYKVKLDGTIIGKFGRAGKRLKEFGSVNSIDCRSENTLLVGEAANMRVQKLTLR